MAAQRMHTSLRPHVPDTSRRVTATSDKQIKLRMQSEAIDCAQVAVILANNLVLLEVPALDLFILAG